MIISAKNNKLLQFILTLSHKINVGTITAMALTPIGVRPFIGCNQKYMAKPIARASKHRRFFDFNSPALADDPCAGNAAISQNSFAELM